MIHLSPDAISPSPLRFVTLEERPDLEQAARALDNTQWPAFMAHGGIHQRILPRLAGDSLARFQLLALLYPGTHRESVVGSARSIPLLGVNACALQTSLPSVMLISALNRSTALAKTRRTMEDWRKLTAINCMISVTVARTFRKSGLAKDLLQGVKDISRGAGFTTLVAPVRPTCKTHYPLQSFEDYCHWHNAEQQPFDPWIRTHAALGANPVTVAPHAVSIYAPLDDWETWTGLRFPYSGDYWIQGGLSPLKIDVSREYGAYSESRLWMAHTLPDMTPKPAERRDIGTYRGGLTSLPSPPAVQKKCLHWVLRR